MQKRERGLEIMPAETIFTTRRKPWDGMGTDVGEASCSEEVLEKAGLNWNVKQKTVRTEDGEVAEGYYANVRDSDGQVLGIVKGRYKVVQNADAFAFTDRLLESGVRYEAAGSLRGGKKTWILARLPKNYRIAPYLVFSNSFDGSASIKIAMTPVRITCNNMLNLALKKAERIWTAHHTGDMETKLEDAKMTMDLAENYMNELAKELSALSRKKISDTEVDGYIRMLLPIATDATETTEQNVMRMRGDLKSRYYDAPDLQGVGMNGYRFINAVSDFATHSKPLRETKGYKENLFIKTMEGNPLIDRAHEIFE